jgi:hypothetical protein
VVCIDTFSHNLINVTKKQCQYHLPEEQYRKILEELYSTGEELPIIMFERHRYAPRVHYRIYTLDVQGKQRVFMEVFDGTSGAYEYIFCKSRKQCINVMEERERGNKKLY